MESPSQVSILDVNEYIALDLKHGEDSELFLPALESLELVFPFGETCAKSTLKYSLLGGARR
jgi:hypothetical protein